MREITIFDRRTATDHQVLVAKVNDQGDLIMEGHDLGLTTEQFWGDSDYEYFRTVQASDVPAVLLHLMKERFQSDSEFKQWLLANGIASRFDSWRQQGRFVLPASSPHLSQLAELAVASDSH